MIVGHIGAAFAARRRWPHVSLGILIVASLLPDLLRVPFLPFGLFSQQSNVYTHGVPWIVLIAAASGLIAWRALRSRSAGVAVAVLVLSHVVLDMSSGTKELWRGGPRGLDLDAAYWQYEFAIEAVILFAGWWLMRGGGVGRPWRLWRVPVLLLALELGVMVAAVYERPYAKRCWIYPFRPCDDNNPLAHRWWAFWQPVHLTNRRP